MRKFLFLLLNLISKPFIGKGLDRYFPFLITMHEKFFSLLSPSTTKIVSLSKDSRLKLKVPTKGISVGMFLLTKGEYEPLETNLFLESLREGDVVFDIGSNIGYYTVLASSKIGEAGVVYSFDPNTSSLQLLKDNISMNNLRNVVVEDIALGDKKGETLFVSDLVHTMRSALVLGKFHSDKLKKLEYEVKVDTIDSFTAENGIKQLDMIKMDVEGAEILVLEGGKEFLTNLKSVKLFVEYNPESLRGTGYEPFTLVEKIESLGFHVVYILDETRNKSIPYSKNNLTETLKHSTYTNLYCEKLPETLN